VDRLFQSIILLARKEQTQTTKSALRCLIVKFNREFALDF
jgi:hypothetical protein